MLSLIETPAEQNELKQWMATTWLAVKVVLLINPPPRLWLLSGEEAGAS